MPLSLDATRHASEETIPRNIEYLIRETYNWFCLSPERRLQYAKIYETRNCEKMPLKFLNKCATRWLAAQPAVQRILDQWVELKLSFEIAKNKNNFFTAKTLCNMHILAGIFGLYKNYSCTSTIRVKGIPRIKQ